MGSCSVKIEWTNATAAGSPLLLLFLLLLPMEQSTPVADLCKFFFIQRTKPATIAAGGKPTTKRIWQDLGGFLKDQRVKEKFTDVVFSPLL